MKRLLTGLLLVPVMTLAAGLVGCGKEDKGPPAPRRIPVAEDGGKGAGGGPKKTIKAGTAKVVGRVVLDGGDAKAADLSGAMAAHKDKDHCLAPSAKPSEKTDQVWLVGKDGGVENVVIWINPPVGSEYEASKATGDAEIDQPHCGYVPHVVVVKPGQKLHIKNSAPILHNTKLDVDALVNKPFGQTIAPKGETFVELNPQEKPITVGCDVHGWMKAKIWVSPHPYVARTGEDGSFVIENVPEGEELTIVAWHESPGYFGEGGKKGKKITFKAGENKLPDLKVPAK